MQLPIPNLPWHKIIYRAAFPQERKDRERERRRSFNLAEPVEEKVHPDRSVELTGGTTLVVSERERARALLGSNL